METRTCKVVRAEDGYGFHLHGERGKIGQIIKQVEPGSAAEQAGLKAGDRVISVNGENVENSTHQEVVAKIKSNPNETTLEVTESELPKDETTDAPVEEVAATDKVEEVKEVNTQEEAPKEESNGVVEAEAVAENGVAATENTTNNDEPDLPDKELRPRLANLEKREGKGYGFNLHSEKGKPGRYIRSVDDGGVAQNAGLKAGDRIIEVNGKNVEFEKHIQVVTAIKESGSSVRILVLDDVADEFFKKCEISATESHVRGILPTKKTSLQSDDILSMDLSALKQKSRGSSKKNQSGASDWQQRAKMFNDL